MKPDALEQPGHPPLKTSIDAPTERYSTHWIEERPSIPFFNFFTTSTINETIDDNHRTLEQFLLFFRNNVKGTLNKGDIP